MNEIIVVQNTNYIFEYISGKGICLVPKIIKPKYDESCLVEGSKWFNTKWKTKMTLHQVGVKIFVMFTDGSYNREWEVNLTSVEQNHKDLLEYINHHC